jgi:hypothetical protein
MNSRILLNCVRKFMTLKIRVVDPDSNESGSRSGLFSQSRSGLDPVLDSEPDSVWIRIAKKGWIRTWIRIQMNPDPQPCLK